MKTLAAGPDRIMQPGKTYNLPSDEAKRLIDGGFAVQSSDPVTRISERPDPEETKGPDDEDEVDEDEPALASAKKV